MLSVSDVVSTNLIPCNFPMKIISNTENPCSFPERSHLIKHQRYHTSTRQYKCEKCGKMYKTERCLKVHNLVHLEKRPFVCSECNKSFISSSKLKQHSNIHTGERPYKCKYCARDFTNFPNWLKHTRRRHKVDHKTGELLQNVPSYVSKKSNKKEKKLKVNETTEAVELPAKTKTESTFTDIYAMSLNSAEELIMEQALEMEESGYLMSPPSDATLGKAGEINLDQQATNHTFLFIRIATSSFTIRIYVTRATRINTR